MIYVGKGAFEVVAQAWDETLGAVDFDREIAHMIMDRAFVALSQRKALVDVDFADEAFRQMRRDPRFTARIRNSAGRAKKILSANTETFVSIEGIFQDEDFSTTVTRDELYAAARSRQLFTRAMLPLTRALASSGFDKQDIDYIVLVGGGTRIPKIRTLLTDFLGKLAGR